jgi:long-chain acyl-CoA synthetase
VQPGEIGEIIARGPNIMLGYWHMPEATAAAIVDGWLHTGDLATVDEANYIYIVDRAKDMIISGGENVYSIEVENALYTHPAVLEAAVIGIPDEHWGEAVHAVVVLKPGMQASAEELINHTRTQIAGYKVPRSIEFFTEALPKSGAGKILKRTLREKYWAGQSRNVH